MGTAAQPPNREECLSIAAARALLAFWLWERLTMWAPREINLVHMAGLVWYALTDDESQSAEERIRSMQSAGFPW